MHGKVPARSAHTVRFVAAFLTPTFTRPLLSCAQATPGFPPQRSTTGTHCHVQTASRGSLNGGKPGLHETTQCKATAPPSAPGTRDGDKAQPTRNRADPPPRALGATRPPSAYSTGQHPAARRGGGGREPEGRGGEGRGAGTGGEGGARRGRDGRGGE